MLYEVITVGPGDGDGEAAVGAHRALVVGDVPADGDVQRLVLHRARHAARLRVPPGSARDDLRQRRRGWDQP